MDVIIFAGGFGTRLSEETNQIPKPMVEIGGIPILIHIMRYYSSFGFNSFIICGGYKVDHIKNYFKNFMENMNNFELDLKENKIKYFDKKNIDWKIKIIDTGLNTMTAGRLLRVQKYISSDKFLLTYGDGLSNVNLNNLIKVHNNNDCIVTLSAVKPNARFGALVIKDNIVTDFKEKSNDDVSRINGGFMIIDNDIFSNISKDEESFEIDILPSLAKQGKVASYEHNDFWYPMDTLREKHYLENLWLKGTAPWKA